jgi:transposase, IS30 family
LEVSILVMGQQVPVVVRREFWRQVRAGYRVPVAAARSGVSARSGWNWFIESGGIPPMDLREPTGRYLALAEREEIAIKLAEGESLRAIGRALGRPASTIAREVARNRLLGGGYRASKAQLKAQARARRPKPARLATNDRLRAYVQDQLESKSRPSPEQIAGRLRVDFPDDESMRVSHETIYQSLYVQGRGALRRELTVALRTGRALRRPRRRPDQRQSRAAGRGDWLSPPVMISERPAEVTDRAVPGHWEGDLILGGTGTASAVATLVERTTRYCLLGHLERGYRAEAVRDAITAVITTLPQHLRRSLTWDQGTEMAQHAQLRIDTGIEIYFCDPHSPWQRGTNENTNGLLRQYLPKGSDLKVHTADDLAEIAAALNNRPRKTLGYRTPAEALNELLTSAPTSPVATTA